MTSSSTSKGALGAARSGHTSFRMLRWLKTAVSVNAVYNQMVKTEHYVFRRLQVHQQQAERQKKSILQQTMIFHGRAESILQDLDMVRFHAHVVVLVFFRMFGMLDRRKGRTTPPRSSTVLPFCWVSRSTTRSVWRCTIPSTS